MQYFLRETRDATSSPVYAEVVMQKSSSNSEWLKSAIDADDSDDDPNERKRSTPNVPPRISVASSNEHKVKVRGSQRLPIIYFQ